ncbi:hypothetical protein CVT25_010756 [Psilocybe cyanescens]|uniref:RING-type domain-containing protein n=1 Tax=Psilocybe cyanescens TaxID=93625 RepID=A0A409WJP0_PSICY|nr:hypothetical protein CVT25_010756 [Psilocybe cyanescens]
MDSHNLPNTISDPTVVPGGQNNDIQQNVDEFSPAPPAERLQPRISADSQAQQPLAADNDVLMETSDYDDLPGLQEVSDSSDSEAESESDRDANEVEMQAVDHDDDEEAVPSLIDVDTPHGGPSSSSTYRPTLYSTAARPSSNRRARVEDDEDEERDRRHPSQRVSSNNRNQSSATSSASQTSTHLPHNQSPASAPPAPHIHRHIIHASFNVAGNLDPNNNLNTLRLFQHLMTPINANNNNNNTPIQNNDPQSPSSNEPRIGGVALSFEIGPGFPIPQGATPQPGQLAVEQGAPDANGQPFPPRNGTFADILGVLGRLGGGIDGETVINFGNMGLGLGMHQEKDDPERAKKLVAGLEVVPVGLVRRLERVGGAGGGMGEEPTNGGDAGCAICWDKLLDGDGEGFGKDEKTDESPEAGSSDSETVQPKIVSLPCAHVFHADCLLPWFARPRHTTCPTCRFNIDPENLTHASMRRRDRRERAASRRAEDGVNSTEGEGPTPEGASEADANDVDGDGMRLPDFLEMMGASGELLRPEEVEIQNRQMTELIARMRADAAPPPPPPGLLSRSRVARAQSAPQESVTHHADDDAPTEMNPLPTATAEANADPAPYPAPTASAAGTPPRQPSIFSIPVLPVPVMIPVSIPAAAHGPAGNHDSIGLPFILRRPRRADYRYLSGVPRTHTPAENAQRASPRTEGDFGHFLSRIMSRGFQQPVPFNSLFPGLPLNRQQQPHPQPTQGTPQPATPGNATAGGSMPGPQFFGTRIIDPLNLPNLPRMTPQSQTPNNAANPPPAQATPQETISNPPNMPRRDVMEIRVDMVFGPGGPFSFPTGNRQGGADRRVGQTPTATGAFMQQMENEMMAQENAQGGPNEDVDMGNDALRREIEGRLFDIIGRRQRTGADSVPGGQQAPTPGQATATPPPAQQPGQQPAPFDDINPAFLAGLNTGMGMGMHFTGTGRSVAEAFSQMFGGIRAQQQQQPAQATPAGQPQPEGEQQPGQPAAEGNPQPQQQQQAPPAGNLPLGFTTLGMFPSLADIFGSGIPERRAPRPRKDWTLPAAPGPTLRQRIERREREAGLRCYDVSCGIGPSDEDPFGVELEAAGAGMKQLSIMSKEDKSELCSHTFHSPCLVTAERVALRGADAVVEDGSVDVSCPVCRGTGCVSKADWDEGVVALL